MSDTIASVSVTHALQRHAVWFFGVYLLGAGFAFWPRYLSDVGSVTNPMVHIHGAVLAAWLVLLVVQGALISTGRRIPHKAIGRWAALVAPLIVIMILVAAHVSLSRDVEPTGRRLVQFAVQCGSAVMFGLFVGLALKHRNDPARHARWMFCTVLTMTSPIFDRVLAFHVAPRSDFLPLFPDGSRTLPFIHFVLITLVVLDWREGRRNSPFAWAWGAFVVSHGFALTLAESAWWEGVALWFRSLPIS